MVCTTAFGMGVDCIESMLSIITEQDFGQAAILRAVQQLPDKGEKKVHTVE